MQRQARRALRRPPAAARRQRLICWRLRPVPPPIGRGGTRQLSKSENDGTPDRLPPSSALIAAGLLRAYSSPHRVEFSSAGPNATPFDALRCGVLHDGARSARFGRIRADIPAADPSTDGDRLAWRIGCRLRAIQRDRQASCALRTPQRSCSRCDVAEAGAEVAKSCISRCCAHVTAKLSTSFPIRQSCCAFAVCLSWQSCRMSRRVR